MNVVEILRKLVEFNTIEDKENKQIMAWIAQYLSAYGFHNELIVDDASGKMNLFSTIGNNPLIMFSGHTDTVPNGEGWSTNPFLLNECNDNLYGLGSCDMKGGIASFLAAVSQIDYNRLKQGINLLFTYDEEIKFGGISNFINKGFKPPKYVIIPEPTEMSPVIASKGCLAFTVAFNGVSSHSSYPDNGVSAILMANEFINDLNVYSKYLKEQLDKNFDIPYTTMNIGKINGGDAVNKVPDKCVMDFEFRTINISQTTDISNKIIELTKKYNCEITSKFAMDAMSCSDLQFIQTIEELSSSKASTVNYLTEASLLQKCGCNVILLGPGPMNAHIVNEFVSKNDLIDLTNIFKAAIEHFCC